MRSDMGTKIVVAVVCSIAVIAISVTLYALGHVRLMAQLAGCEQNVKLIALAFRLYADKEPRGYYPVLDPAQGRLAAKWDAVYPRYLTEPGILTCPANEKAPVLPAAPAPNDIARAMDDHSYWYLGYALPNQERLLAFRDAYNRRVAEGGDFEGDLDDGHGAPLLRLRQGVERMFIPDGAEWTAGVLYAASIPILVERPDNHKGGGHVLFLDGRIEFIPFPGKYPMTPEVVQALRSMDIVVLGGRTQPNPGNPSVPKALK
ncbi:MAG TPA: hypothetical protein PKY01_06175 [Candidatus Hydrogenedentes bacterium]|nr:hypothetical protein [Candidatus Hydrogenedentota bacterium]HQH51992.1 hypothetical protein [Candidatus Hydrogenedentota bacterium]HQM50140.1 hypothetical protein [Candidatus Hydrogenedentota bacterium]